MNNSDTCSDALKNVIRLTEASDKLNALLNETIKGMLDLIQMKGTYPHTVPTLELLNLAKTSEKKHEEIMKEYYGVEIEKVIGNEM